MSAKSFLKIILVIILLLTIKIQVCSSTHWQIKKHYLQDLNGDGYCDTLMIDSSNSLRLIVWGNNQYSDSNKTYIKYGDSTYQSSRYSFIKFNRDTTKDLFIINKHRINDKDTNYHFVLIGNNKLIHVDTITFFTDRIEPEILDVFVGASEIFESVSFISSGSMVVASFKKLEIDTAAQVPMADITTVKMYAQPNIHIYPNPVNMILFYSLIDFEPGIYFIEVQNLLLQSVYNGAIEINSPVYHHYIDLSDKPNGTYLIRFYNNKIFGSKLFILSM